MDSSKLQSIIQLIVTNSNTYTTWSLSIFGGSLLAILSNEYVKPLGKRSKLIYFLFIPGWFLLAQSIRCGDLIMRSSIMSSINPNNSVTAIKTMNDHFESQISYFNYAITIFGIWLALFLLWWIFQDYVTKKINDKH